MSVACPVEEGRIATGWINRAGAATQTGQAGVGTYHGVSGNSPGSLYKPLASFCGSAARMRRGSG